MKRRYSNRAILSVALGFAGAAVGIMSAGRPPIPALLLGVAAIITGGAGMRAVRQGRPAVRGTGFAVLGIGLGVLVTVFSALFLFAMFLQQVNRQQRWQQARNQSVQLERVLARNPVANEPAAHFTSNLPIVVLHTASQSISRGNSTPVRAQFFDTGNGRASVDATPAYDGRGTIQLRGHTSLNLPKRSYTFHTVDAQGRQIKVPLLGLPREEDWVLYAPFEDKTLIRDALAFDLARQMGHYAPRTRFVELFVASSDRPLSRQDYVGVYVLMEKIKRGKDRVNIQKLDPQQRSEPDITGGYIVKRDHDERPESRFHTEHGGPYFYVYPKADEITAQQKSWLARYFNSFEAALYGNDFQNSKTGYAAYLDVDAFIDAHWLIEMSKNVDGFRYSAFLTKDRGGKLKPEPPWDWNRSFGNANYYGGGQAQGWYWPHLRPNEISWFLRLREDPEFARRCANRWRQLRQSVFAPENIGAKIDELAARLEEAQQRNYERWPVLGQQITCNFYVGDSYQEEIRWMKNWIERRIAWIDNQLGGPSNL